MNKVFLSGRIVRDPEIKISGETKIARYSLAVDRIRKREGQPTADFITCVAFGKTADFAEKYMLKGRRFIVTGSIQTGSYTKQDGTKVYTTDILVESQEFADAKPDTQHSAPQRAPQSAPASSSDDFMSIPEDSGEELPFS